MQDLLVLFDIDGTLLDLRGIGLDSLRRAAQDLHRTEIPKLDLRGATDAGLVRDILELCGVPHTADAERSFYDAYLVRLAEGLSGDSQVGELLPGVESLLQVLLEAEVTLGLLTGNVEEGARLKLRHFGLEDYFSFGAFGHEHVDRNELGPVTLQRAQEVHGRSFLPAQVIVIGDTPKDVACGQAMGATTIAVATGSFTAEELMAYGPSLVVGDLAQSGEVIEVLQATSSKEN